MKRGRIAIIVAVVGLALLAGVLVSRYRPAEPEDSTGVQQVEGGSGATRAGESRKGPRGGKYFTADGFGLEVTIFESGVPPRFRLYLYQGGKPLAPAAARVSVTLSRLGAQPEVFSFAPEGDYLLGDRVVEEPHSFDVAITAEHGGRSFRWHYSQVEARVAMPDAVLASTGIEILTAGPATIRPTLTLPGEIAFNDETMVEVVPRVAGVVISVNRDLGERVRRGELLAVIESQMLADLRSQLAAARKRMELARSTLERERVLWEEKISAKQDYLLAEQAMSEARIAVDLAAENLRALGVAPEAGGSDGNLARFEIRASIDGVIVAKSVARGEALKPDTGIFTVADVSTVWAYATVYPKDLAVVKVGQKATVRSTAFAAQAIGTVSHIGALVGEQTRTARARITLRNAEGIWRPGMFVEVALVAEELQVPVAVSADAIQTLRDWSVVFGRYGDYFEARPLELGRSDGQMIEVLKGLSAGERYAGGNSFAVKAELGKAGATHDH